MKAKCPNCGAALTVAPTCDKFNCPNCGKSLRVRPKPQSAEQSVRRRADSPPATDRQAAEKPPGSARAWWALAVAVVAGFAPPGRILLDVAAIVLAVLARREIFGAHSLKLAARPPLKRGVWSANIALIIGVGDLFLIVAYIA